MSKQMAGMCTCCPQGTPVVEKFVIVDSFGKKLMRSFRNSAEESVNWPYYFIADKNKLDSCKTSDYTTSIIKTTFFFNQNKLQFAFLLSSIYFQRRFA